MVCVFLATGVGIGIVIVGEITVVLLAPDVRGDVAGMCWSVSDIAGVHREDAAMGGGTRFMIRVSE